VRFAGLDASAAYEIDEQQSMMRRFLDAVAFVAAADSE
jgi:hypothetical protein